MYGYDLSSRRRTFSGGRWRLIICCSSSSASLALATTIASIDAARRDELLALAVALDGREVRRHALAHRRRLADVEHGALGRAPDVHAGGIGQRPRLVAQIGCWSFGGHDCRVRESPGRRGRFGCLASALQSVEALIQVQLVSSSPEVIVRRRTTPGQWPSARPLIGARSGVARLDRDGARRRPARLGSDVRRPPHAAACSTRPPARRPWRAARRRSLRIDVPPRVHPGEPTRAERGRRNARIDACV